jgi:hypothetical protein
VKPVTFFFLTGVVEYLDIVMIIAIFVMQGKRLYVIIYNVKLGAYLLLAVLLCRHHGSLVQWTEQEISNLPTKVRLLHESHSSDLSIPIWYGTDR